MLGDVHSNNLSKLLDVAALRSKVHAANIANQNTPGYKAQRVAFDEAFQQALADGTSTEDVQPTLFQPENTPVQADGNDVAVDREVLDQAQNSTLYNAYLSMMQGRKKLLTIAISSAPGG